MRAFAVVGGVLLLAGCGTAPAASTYTPSITVAPASSESPTPTPTASATPTPTPTPTATTATGVVAAMSLQQQAGTVLMTAATVDEFPTLASLVRDGAVGGVMIRGRSSAGVQAVASAVGKVTAASHGVPLLVATDEEGGEVQVLSGPGFGDIPSAVDQATESPAALTSATKVWGRALSHAGVNLDLAPVADTPCPAFVNNNPPVADLDRNYGTDPAAAARSVAAVVHGLAATGVGATVKHFPGLGCVSLNTDTDAHVVDDSITVSSARLQPFSSGIGAGAQAVMVSSAIYDLIDGSEPALFSSTVIGGLLRGRLGFTGVVMSDDVGGAAALKAWTPAQRATKFVDAGGDLLLDIVPADIPQERAALVDAAKSDPSFAAKLRAAAVQVVTARLSVGR